MDWFSYFSWQLLLKDKILSSNLKSLHLEGRDSEGRDVIDMTSYLHVHYTILPTFYFDVYDIGKELWSLYERRMKWNTSLDK